MSHIARALNNKSHGYPQYTCWERANETLITKREASTLLILRIFSEL